MHETNEIKLNCNKNLINTLVYSKNDVIIVNDVMDIKFCSCQQISKNYISNESSHQEQLNDTCFK